MRSRISTAWKIDTTYMSFRMIHYNSYEMITNCFFCLFVCDFLIAGLLLYWNSLFIMLCCMPELQKFNIHSVDVCHYVACRSNYIWHRSCTRIARLAEKSPVLCKFNGNFFDFSTRTNNGWLFGCCWILGRISYLFCIGLFLCSDGCYDDRRKIITWRTGWHSKWFLGYQVYDCNCNCGGCILHTERTIWDSLDVDRIDWWCCFYPRPTCSSGWFCTQLGRDLGWWVTIFLHNLWIRSFAMYFNFT